MLVRAFRKNKIIKEALGLFFEEYRLSDDFDTAGIEQCQVDKIDQRILVEVEAATPIRFITAGLKPARRENT